MWGIKPAAPPASTHPYYPIEAQVVGYLANTYSVPWLLASFAGGCVVIFGITLALVALYTRSTARPRLSRLDTLTVLWFVLCGCIHTFFEGYFSLNHTRMGSRQDVFGQLWKEYSLSDSRYLTSDPFVLCMETITAFAWGPLSIIVVGLIVTNHPLRHPLQALLSLGQLYGDVLYYATSLFDLYYKGVKYCRPEAYYFWAYYFLMNAFWIVIPAYLIFTSVSASTRAFRALDRMSRSLQNGAVKKGQ